MWHSFTGISFSLNTFFFFFPEDEESNAAIVKLLVTDMLSSGQSIAISDRTGHVEKAHLVSSQ